MGAGAGSFSTNLAKYSAFIVLGAYGDYFRNVFFTKEMLHSGMYIDVDMARFTGTGTFVCFSYTSDTAWELKTNDNRLGVGLRGFKKI